MTRIPLLLLMLCPLQAATNTLRFESVQTRVLVVTDPADLVSRPHDHKVDRVMIYLTPGEMTLTETSGKVDTLTFKAGEALWSPATGIHVSRNTCGHPLRIIEIELKQRRPTIATTAPAASSWDMLTIDPRHYKPDWENDRVRVIRAQFGPHETSVPNHYAYHRVVAFLTDGTLTVTPTDGASKTIPVAAGDVIGGDPGIQIETNAGDRPLEFVIVEFKQ